MSQIVDLAAFTACIWVLTGMYLIIALTPQKKACSALGTGSSRKVGSITAGVDAGVVTAIYFGFTSHLVVESGCGSSTRMTWWLLASSFPNGVPWVLSSTSAGCLFCTLLVEAAWKEVTIGWNWSYLSYFFFCAPYPEVLGAEYLA